MFLSIVVITFISFPKLSNLQSRGYTMDKSTKEEREKRLWIKKLSTYTISTPMNY